MVGRYLGVHDDGGKSDGSFGGKNTLTCRGTGWLVGDGECKHFISCVNILCICLHRVHVKITVANQILVPRQMYSTAPIPPSPLWQLFACLAPSSTQKSAEDNNDAYIFLRAKCEGGWSVAEKMERTFLHSMVAAIYSTNQILNH